ncbi:RHS repeat-associated protein [Filimonas zeae]|uniref:DUF6443 domain-containing protein n=1 Tax=Filimonas zeae TaxID=1737353 RepID=A0A917J0P7_9BACT|nr:DUF6443 domain-containing protein [Filimonas zeae]MDR6341231.1 RHS repeat-associated protein [Filimonas zeae]GGH76703.1 hypothetical protein GCM10011379_41940 [Filimonas zeae]
MEKKIFFVVSFILSLALAVSAQVKPLAEGVSAAQTVANKPGAYLPGTPLNYVRTWVPARPLTVEADVISASRTVREVARSTSYVDGLGRPLQTVTWQGSPVNDSNAVFDLVSPVVYDELGREKYKYLPYTSTGNSGVFKTTPFADQETFMSARYPGEQVYYAQIDYESAPINRVLKSMAPGNSWAGSGRGVQSAYELNAADEVRVWTIGFATGSVPASPGFYAPGVLYRTVTTDEHGKRTVEYKNKTGQVVLKKAEITDGAAITAFAGWLHTYYVYDDLRMLRYVIQPKGVEQLSVNWAFDATTWSGSNIAKELCFSYEYDSQNRMIIKRVPGAGEVHMVYDARDRLVMTQDARMRTSQHWLVTQYDDFNRPAKTYLWTSASARATHATAAAGSTNYPGVASPVDGYLTVTFYDNYDWVSTSGSGLAATFASGETTADFLAASDVNFPYPRAVTSVATVKGMVTGMQVKVLGTSQYLFTINYYDDRGRLVQTKSTNTSGATDISTTQYSFDGKALMTKNSHATTAMTPGTVKVMTRQSYDHAGRLLAVKKQVNNGAWVVVDSLIYDAAGQLLTKRLGQKKPGGVYNSLPIETLTYAYNIRGWLTGINKGYVANPTGVNNFFGEEISYNYGFTQKQYNGNIAGITWCSRNDQQVRSYGYTYDAVSRLLKADFTEKINATTWNTSLGRDYTTVMGNGSNPSLAYDANGNILRMQHYVTPSVRIDDLTYNYDFSVAGNRLKRVTDAFNNAASTLGDFKEITSGQTQDYDYDGNGNMVYDLNKGISNIAYNYLNLPSLITVTGKGSVAYTYDARGNKLKKVVTDATNSNAVTTTSYIGSFQYENNDLKQLAHEEGRIRRKPDGSYAYDYFVKDHLGNIRATLTEEETVSVYKVATMELDSAAQEETYYANLAETRAFKPAAYPDRDSTNRYVAKLDGRQKKLGPSLLLKVNAGDKINIRAKSWYQHNGKDKEVAMPFAGTVSGLLGNTLETELLHDGPVLQAASGAAAILPGVISFLQTRDATDEKISRKPKAYLNWVLLDEDLKPVKEDTARKSLKQPEYAGFQRVGEEEKLTQHVKEGWEVEKSGYVYVFTSSESADADVVFEDLGVTSIQGPLLEVDHYYPFGLSIAGIGGKAEGRLQNKFKYNGKELQNKEFADGSGLEWFDYGARMYDVQVGRWNVIDPKSEKYNSISTYQYCMNNPLLYIDPDGRDNVVYLHGLDGISKNELKELRKQVNANFASMKLKTRAEIFKGKDFSKFYSQMDKNDAVAFIGKADAVINAVNSVDKVLGKTLREDPDFGSKGATNPEHSQFKGNIIAINTEDAKIQSKDFHVSMTEAIAFDVVHGAGHNAGLGHGGDRAAGDASKRFIPSHSIMSDGERLLSNVNQGPRPIVPEFSKLGDFVKTTDNHGVIRDFYMKRFENSTPKANKNIPVQ